MKLKRIATVICAAVLIAGLALTGGRLYDYKVSAEISQKAIELALPKATYSEAALGSEESLHEAEQTVAVAQAEHNVQEALPEAAEQQETLPPIPEDAELLFETDLKALKEINPDVLGWIYIPNGNISYPILQTDDNSTYLNHAWDGTKSSSGSIFMERRNRADFSNFNTVIYGHNVRNYSFFAPLHTYEKESHKNSHPFVYIVTETEVRQYKIFAAYKTKIDTHTYRLVFKGDAERQAAIDFYKQSSVWQDNTEVTAADYILTLSTCTHNGSETRRWVVQAVLEAAWPRQ